MRCEECGLPDNRHTSECPVYQAARAARRSSADGQQAKDLEEWHHDPDAKMIMDAVCAKYGVANIGQLDLLVLADLHEAVKTMMDESPPIDFLGDPRRTM